MGGNRIGTRIPRMYRENISSAEILAILDELIGNWSKNRLTQEGFGDFLVRTDVVKPVVNSAVDFYEVQEAVWVSFN